jgi:hypothetical protein
MGKGRFTVGGPIIWAGVRDGGTQMLKCRLPNVSSGESMRPRASGFGHIGEIQCVVSVVCIYS